MDLNHRPKDYEAFALTAWATSPSIAVIYNCVAAQILRYNSMLVLLCQLGISAILFQRAVGVARGIELGEGSVAQ